MSSPQSRDNDKQPILFARFAELLEKIWQLYYKRPALKQNAIKEKTNEWLKSWFAEFAPQVDAYLDPTHPSPAALISTFQPELRPERRYGLQEAALSKLLGSVLCLGESNLKILNGWTKPRVKDVDLPSCLERVLRDLPLPKRPNPSTVDDVDAFLELLAQNTRYLEPSVREELPCDSGWLKQRHDRLHDLLSRMSPLEAKWLVRLVLVDFGSIELDPFTVQVSIHPLLPMVLKVYDNICEALKSLVDLGPKDVVLSERKLTDRASTFAYFKPKINVKVGRPKFLKAWSVDLAIKNAGGRKMTLEQKYDGEYAQIHIHKVDGDYKIKIFSKSGKDSTWDRECFQPEIRRSLQLDSPSCPIKHSCILEAELVIYSDRDEMILPFHKIRKHVTRVGRRLGTKKDSQPHPWEHQMLVYFDLLLLDDESLLPVEQQDRRTRLTNLITERRGRSAIATAELIDFGRKDAANILCSRLAHAFAQRWEGYILKGANDTYINLNNNYVYDRVYPSCWIKLKQFYIPGFGDTADLTAIGAGYSAKEAVKKGMEGFAWTHLFLGCMLNREAVKRHGERPHYRVVSCLNHGLDSEKHKHLLEFAASRVYHSEAGDSATFDVEECTEPGNPSMDTLFACPFVIECSGVGFDKPSDSDFYTLRFPQIVRLRSDLEPEDCVDFPEFEKMAEEAVNAPKGESFQKDLSEWESRLHATLKKDTRGACDSDESRTTTPTKSATTTPAKSTLRVTSPAKASPQLRRVLFPTKNIDTQHGLITPPRSSALSSLPATEHKSKRPNSDQPADVIQPPMKRAKSVQQNTPKTAERIPLNDITNMNLKVARESQPKQNKETENFLVPKARGIDFKAYKPNVTVKRVEKRPTALSATPAPSTQRSTCLSTQSDSNTTLKSVELLKRAVPCAITTTPRRFLPYRASIMFCSALASDPILMRHLLPVLCREQCSISALTNENDQGRGSKSIYVLDMTETKPCSTALSKLIGSRNRELPGVDESEIEIWDWRAFLDNELLRQFKTYNPYGKDQADIEKRVRRSFVGVLSPGDGSEWELRWADF